MREWKLAEAMKSKDHYKDGFSLLVRYSDNHVMASPNPVYFCEIDTFAEKYKCSQYSLDFANYFH